MRASRARIRALLDEVCERHPPRVDVDLDDLADQFVALFEGGFVLERSLSAKGLTAGQLRLYRSTLELLFR